jgi:hypothetical protein
LQAERLQQEVAELQGRLVAAGQHEAQVHDEVAAAAQERADIQLQQQQLQYERQLQELQLANKYLTTMEALLTGSPSGVGGSGGTAAAAAAAAAARSVFAASGLDGSGSSGGSMGVGAAGVDARVRRVLEGQAARAEAAEVRVCVSVAGCTAHTHTSR